MSAAIDLPGEEWRQFPGWEDRYEISSLGRVRNIPRIVNRGPGTYSLPVKIRKLWKGSIGYPTITLAKEGRFHSIFVHRAVCEAFHGPCPSPAHEVAHYDGTRTNNRADNLRWATRSENRDDQRRHGTLVNGHRNGRAKFTLEQVAEIRASGESVRELARLYQTSGTTIRAIVAGERYCER